MRRTRRVCEIKFEKRGPMATYSSNLQYHIRIFMTRLKQNGKYIGCMAVSTLLESRAQVPFNIIKNYDAELRFVCILKNLANLCTFAAFTETNHGFC